MAILRDLNEAISHRNLKELKNIFDREEYKDEMFNAKYPRKFLENIQGLLDAIIIDDLSGDKYDEALPMIVLIMQKDSNLIEEAIDFGLENHIKYPNIQKLILQRDAIIGDLSRYAKNSIDGGEDYLSDIENLKSLLLEKYEEEETSLSESDSENSIKPKRILSPARALPAGASKKDHEDSDSGYDGDISSASPSPKPKRPKGSSLASNPKVTIL